MKKKMCAAAILIILSFNGYAQDPISSIIKQAVTEVIVAVDLKIQRLQNKTIWLQNAQKTLENKMSELKLGEIRDWAEEQRKLYEDYFRELSQVKSALAYYHRVKEIIQQQVALVKEYKAAWALFQQDKNFTAEELDAMISVYSGMMQEGVKNLDGLFLVVNSFQTSMSDAERLDIINSLADKTEAIYTDLNEFTNQNKLISIQRASEKGDLDYVKRLYGL